MRDYGRETLDPSLPAAGGLSDRRDRDCPAFGAGECGVDGNGDHVRGHALLSRQVGASGLRSVSADGDLHDQDISSVVVSRSCRSAACDGADVVSSQ